MSPEVIAFICSSVLIFLVFLSSAIILIHRRLCHPTQSTTQAEAQVQDPTPLASESKEKVDDVFSPTSSTSKSLAAEPLLPPIAILRPASAAATKDTVKKLVSKTSAALSKADKIEEENPIFNLSTSLAALDAEIVNSRTARRHSRRFSSARPVSLTSGTATSSSANASTHAKSQTHSTAAPSGISDRSSTRPSPTIMSVEARPTADRRGRPSGCWNDHPECDLPVYRLRGGPHNGRGRRISKLSAGLERKTPRQGERGARAEKSSSTSVSTVLTLRDTTFSSDADSVSEVGSCEAPVNNMPFKLGDVLVPVFGLSFDLSSGKSGDVMGLHPSPGSDVLNSCDTKSEHGSLTTPALADTSF